MIFPGDWDAIYVLVHDGVFSLETGAGVSNARFINCLVRLGFGERLSVGAVETAAFARDYSSAHHLRMRSLIEGAGGRIFTVPNGSGGRDRYGDIQEWRRTADAAIRRLDAELPSHAHQRTLVISFDIAFVRLVRLLAERMDAVHVHVPRSTGALYDPAHRGRRRLEHESFDCSPAVNTFIGAVGSFMRRHLEQVYRIGSADLIDLRNGVTPDLPDPNQTPGHASPGAELHAARTRLSLTRGAPFVLAYGRGAPHKGFDVLLDALARAAELELKCVLIATETGGDRAAVGRLTTQWRALAIDGALVTDFDQRLPRILRRSEDLAAIVVPSRAEAFGLIPAECFADAACTAPVIAARTGGLVEQVADGVTGLSFEPGDVEALAACLRRAAHLSSNQKRRLKRNAARLAADRYDYLANVRSFFADLSRRLAHARVAR